MDTKKEKLKQIVGNLALIQAQAAVIAFLAAVFAIILGWVPKGEFRLDHALLLCASSLATASLASLVLGKIICTSYALVSQELFLYRSYYGRCRSVVEDLQHQPRQCGNPDSS